MDLLESVGSYVADNWQWLLPLALGLGAGGGLLVVLAASNSFITTTAISLSVGAVVGAAAGAGAYTLLAGLAEPHGRPVADGVAPLVLQVSAHPAGGVRVQQAPATGGGIHCQDLSAWQAYCRELGDHQVLLHCAADLTPAVRAAVQQSATRLGITRLAAQTTPAP